jgi:hypothetical protein
MPQRYLPGGSSEVSDPRLPCACVALMSFIVANAFMDAFGVTTDTLLLSFCFDEQLQKEEADQGYVLACLHMQGAHTHTQPLSRPREQGGCCCGLFSHLAVACLRVCLCCSPQVRALRYAEWKHARSLCEECRLAGSRRRRRGGGSGGSGGWREGG